MPVMTKRLFAIFLISLALNIFFVGAMVSYWAAHGGGPVEFKTATDSSVNKHRGHSRKPISSFAGRHRGFNQQIDGKIRKALGQMRSQHGEEMRTLRHAMRVARLNSLTAISAEPFDKTVLKEELSNALESVVASRTAFHNAVVEATDGLTPNQRRKLFLVAIRIQNRKFDKNLN